MPEPFALDGYVVEALIGFGGTGEVWRAHEVTTGETVALKRLRTRGSAATERLRREAGLLATVAGPHVVGVRRMLVEADEAVLVLDYAPGGSLAAVLATRGRLTAPEVVTVLAPIAAALAAAHTRQLVHGDITPANILFTSDGRPLLSDFGVARVLGGPAPVVVEATADFLDPGVAAGGPPTAAADVFSLGAVGFTALTGQPIWGSGSAEERIARAARAERGSLSDSAPTTPDALVAVIEAMLRPDPDYRPDARAAGQAILRSGAAAPVGLTARSAPPSPAVTHPVRPATGGIKAADEGGEDDEDKAAKRASRRSRWARHVVAVGAVGAVLVLGALVGIGLGSHGKSSAAVLPPAPVLSLPPSLVGGGAGHPTAPSKRSSPATPTPSLTRADWAAIVGRLDALRARAFSLADPTVLAAVYVPGSAEYADDVRTVRSLASRGLRARGFTSRVDAVSVEPAAPDGPASSPDVAGVERLRVVDALSAYSLVDASGAVVGQGQARPPRAFTMRLRQIDGRWLVASVSPTA